MGKEKWRVQTPAAEDALEIVGEVVEAKEVKAEMLVGLSQGRYQRLGPARNLKAIFLPLAQETRARMVTC
jgi:hypothetical protein